MSKDLMALMAAVLFAATAGASAADKTKDRPEPLEISNEVGMTFVSVPPGTFTMGSPSTEPGRDPDEHPHTVTLSRGFYIQTTEVTQGQWKAVMGHNAANFRKCGDECPVEGLSWDEVQTFIAELNELEPDKQYRLPTEAEWEYVARAGTETPFHTGECLPTDQANYHGGHPMPDCPEGEYRQQPIPVASFPPNPWGVYDMHGNVWEIVKDWYGTYPDGHVIDPIGPSSGDYRVVRGGSWRFFASFARSANRFKSIRDFTGMRLVLVRDGKGETD